MFLMARRIANLTDARYFAAKEVHYLAFNLTPGTPGYLDPVLMQAMREWVQGPKIVGEFGEGISAAYIREAAAFYQLDAVIVAPTALIESDESTEVWVRMESHNCSGQPSDAVTGYLLEWPTEQVPDTWQARSIVQFEGDATAIQSFLSNGKWLGISVSGGEEEQVGVKSFDDVEAIFDVLESLQS
jgi:phosphoribosylanthranilate isomerase